MKLTFFLIFFTFFISIPFINCTDDSSDDLLVEKIASILRKEYDNYKEKSFTERVILALGRNAYMDSVKLWKNNYKDIYSMKIKLHPSLEHMAKVGEKNLPPERAFHFRTQLTDLTRIAFVSLQMYYTSMKDYLTEHPTDYRSITIRTMEDALCRMKYYNEKKVLYEKEDCIKNEIRAILSDERLKHKLSLYSFAFEFFDKIRKEIIAKELDKMLNRIKEKEES